jgi:hypothetical protein
MASTPYGMNVLAGLSLGPTVSRKGTRSTNSEAVTVDQAHQMPQQTLDRADQNASPDQPPADHDELAPYSTRVRVILGLSLLSWLLVAAGVLWLIRAF